MTNYNWKRIAEIKENLMVLFGELPDFFAGIKDGEEIEKQGINFGDLQNDTELKMDKYLGSFIHGAWIKKNLTDSALQMEGFGDLGEDWDLGEAEYWLTADPLDGSLNYKLRGHSLGLPMTTCMALLKRQGNKTFFSDVLFGGVMDFRAPNDFWWAELLENGEYKSYFNAKPARTMDVSKLDIGSQILFADMYYPSNREQICKAFVGERGSIRNSGSSAYEMAMVASGHAIAFLCDRQKQHELGAAYALIKGAGGVLVDWHGKDLGEREYFFNAQTPVVLAANQAIAEQILERLHRV